MNDTPVPIGQVFLSINMCNGKSVTKVYYDRPGTLIDIPLLLKYSHKDDLCWEQTFQKWK